MLLNKIKLHFVLCEDKMYQELSRVKYIQAGVNETEVQW